MVQTADKELHYILRVYGSDNYFLNFLLAIKKSINYRLYYFHNQDVHAVFSTESILHP